jgi:hypothetical protein
MKNQPRDNKKQQITENLKINILKDKLTNINEMV